MTVPVVHMGEMRSACKIVVWELGKEDTGVGDEHDCTCSAHGRNEKCMQNCCLET